MTGYEAESVTFTSYVSKESAIVRWLKSWTPVEGERFRARMEGLKRTFTIDPLKRSDAGEYICDINTDQIHFSLLVKGRNRFSFVSSDGVVRFSVWTETNRLALRCRNANQVREATSRHSSSCQWDGDPSL